RCVGGREFPFEDRLLDFGGAAAAPLLPPVHAEVARRVQLLLPRAADLHEAVLRRARITQLLAPGADEVGSEPAAQRVAELEMAAVETQVHGRFPYGGGPAPVKSGARPGWRLGRGPRPKRPAMKLRPTLRHLI